MVRKGNIPWNKGLVGVQEPYWKGKNHSEETKLKISNANKGKIPTKETIEKNRLAHLGKKLSEEHRKKLVESSKGSRFKKEHIPWNKNKLTKEIKIKKSRLGQRHTEETKLKISNSKKGNVIITNDMRKRISEKLKGEKSYLWKGGITKQNQILRHNVMFKIWREAVFLRDKFTCQNKNCKYCNNKVGGQLQAHHIKPFALFPELRFDVNNGITYCKNYHINSKELHKNIRK